jgi:hypothetical protein
VQDYWDRIIGTESTVKSVITFWINTSSNNQQWQPPLPDRPCAQHVQSTRRMSLTVKRPSTQGLPFQLKPRLVVSHSTCPPLSPSPNVHSFVLGRVINIIEGPRHSFTEIPKHKTTIKRKPTCDTKINAIQITTASEIDHYRSAISRNPIRTPIQKLGKKQDVVNSIPEHILSFKI